MKLIRRISLIALVCLILLSCSSKDSSTNKTTITFWGHQNDAWSASYKNIAKEYEKHNPQVIIKFEFFPYNQFQSKVQTSMMSKDGGADIYALWGGWGIDFAHTGSLEPMSKDLTKLIKDNYYEPTYGSLLYEDDIYGLPLEYNIEYGGMLVNDKLLDEANLSVPITWDELRSTALKATKIDNNKHSIKGFDFVNWDSVPYMLTAMILSQGVDYQDDNGTFNFNTPEAIKAYTELSDMILKDKVTDMIGLSGGGDLEGYQQLFAGTTVMVPRGPWTIAEGEFSFGLKYGSDFEYVAMPWYDKKEQFAAETGWSLAVNANSKVKDESMKFLEYMAEEDNLLKHNVACAQIPADQRVANNPELIAKMPYAKPLLNILDKGKFIGYFNTDVFKEEVNANFESLISGKFTSPTNALQALSNSLNDRLNK